MLKNFLAPVLTACFLLLLAACGASQTRINGDGGEYLLMTHAFRVHDSPEIRPDDIEAFANMPLDMRQAMNFPDHAYAPMREHFKTPQAVPFFGFVSVEPNRYYSIHFWLYSLLAVPFYVLTEMTGQNPIWAFALENAAWLFAALLYLRRVMPGRILPAAALLVAGGASFYLHWTGPEVMSAASALIACVAMLRGELGVAMLMAGVGTTQNPSMIFLMPCALAWRVILVRWPSLAWAEAGPAPLRKRDAALFACGVALALLPYLFSYVLFGVPSLPGKYFTSTSLISMNRLISLVLDFDQGMLFGLPALFIAPVLAGILLVKRRSWFAAAALMIAAALAMALPTLAAQNWNSGCVVVSRYGYWLAMPLLAAALLAVSRLNPARSAAVAMAAFACQCTVFAQYGLYGETSYALRHSAIAEWVLAHHPALYHPDPEIFFERTTHSEVPMPLDLTLVYGAEGRQFKLMRNTADAAPTPEYCPPGLRLEGTGRTKADRGWLYENPPFACRTPLPRTDGKDWITTRSHSDSQAILGSGWSTMETYCTWSNGAQSELDLPVPANGKPLRLRMQGHYYLDQEKSEIEINGERFDSQSLEEGLLDLPASFDRKPVLSLVLRHPLASSPASHGGSRDVRKLGFCLEMVSVETLPE